ncbi:MAG: hypothetical protein QUS13_03365 [Smithella sp.]|nr:hypothetical protein [Smithella sp.]
MENFSSKDKKIFEDMKQCFLDLRLKIIKEDTMPDALCGMSTFEYPGYNMGIGFLYIPSHSIADLTIRYADFQSNRLPELYELMNFINVNMINSHFCIEPITRMVLLHTGMNVTGYFLNKMDFKTLLSQLMGAGHTFFPLIAKLHSNDQTVQSIIDEFIAKKNQIPPEFLGPDGKVKAPKVTKEHPFIIEVSADMPAFPSHTHGLTEVGMPEFLIDHLAFGASGNGGRITASYEYFTKPENAGKLDAIKNGETVKLTINDLKHDAKPEDIVYCYRRVYPEFEMVKQAYLIEDPKDVDPKMWFVQIYVEGDDFALTDDYYKGGIKF